MELISKEAAKAELLRIAYAYSIYEGRFFDGTRS